VVDVEADAGGRNDRRNVLIVDDEPLVRWSIAEMLREAGYWILEASDASTALRQAQPTQESLDAILLDLWLPDSNDLTLLERLHQQVTAPIIVMTAHGTPELTEQALERGAYALLNKPFSMADIVGIVEHARGDRVRPPRTSGSSGDQS
jgi:DNA-binding NtrC family response regulator